MGGVREISGKAIKVSKSIRRGRSDEVERKGGVSHGGYVFGVGIMRVRGFAEEI